MKRKLFFLFLWGIVVQNALAQFSGSISGYVMDPNDAAIPNVKIQLKNVATDTTQTAQSDAQGIYHFFNLAPSNYELTAHAQGFSEAQSYFTLETSQALAFDLKLQIGSTAQAVQVTEQAPVMDTGDTRLQQTLTTDALSSLPLAGRSMISLAELTPGVTGLGVTSNGSPGSGRDNYSTETQVDASANGQGSVSNMYVLDGIDVDSDARPGVLNMTPNPDAIQETSIQTNTFNVDYGRATSLVMMLTTKSGTSRFHGNASLYFYYQGLFAGTEFTHKYLPFHSNNMSATVGGPIIPNHKMFFFFAIEPLRSSQAVAYSATFEDPLFTQYANATYPNTVGTKLLNTYPVSNVTSVSQVSTAATLFPGTCDTSATNFLPCDLPMIDSGNYSGSTYRNGTQYSVRIDKDFKADRIYGTIFRTTAGNSNPNPREAFTTPNRYYQRTFQVNEYHTFSPNTLNQAAFGVMRDEGNNEASGQFSVPVVSVQGIGQGFGSGFANADFIQHNYHWRDVLTHTYKSHTINVGYEGYFADDIEDFGDAYDQPNFSFNSLLDLAEDKPYTESSVAYNPISGQHVQYDWNAAGMAYGLFVQDAWRANRHLAITYGVRYDDFGNPYSRDTNTALSNFYYGSGATFEQQVANGSLIQSKHSFPRSINNIFSPRVGIAWDLRGDAKWLVKAGVGVYHNWPTLAITEEQYRGAPPGPIFPTFYATQAPFPIFGEGTSNSQAPYGYTYPTLPASQLDAHGGIQGLQFTVGAIDPHLNPPVNYIYSGSLSRELNQHMVAAVSYTGSTGRHLFAGGNNVSGDVYGQDINAQPGDLIAHNSLVPTRLNSSFGQIIYESANRESKYDALILSLTGRFSKGFITASYTRSQSMDDMGGSQGTLAFPSYINFHQWYGPSLWDTPDRFSLGWAYKIPGPHNLGLVETVAGGWELSGTGILQSGTPFTVYTNSPFLPLTDSSGTFTGYAPGSGDFNADGDNVDYPDASTYSVPHSRSAYLKGIFTSSSFSVPATFGAEGNEKYDGFRNPGFEQFDVALLKNTKIRESLTFQLRLDSFNILNHPNLTGVDANLPDGTFGKATGQNTPRFFQIGGNLIF